MEYFRVTFLILSTWLLVFSCQQEQAAMDDLSTGELASAVKEKQDFDGFYIQFHRDSTFQMEHIQFPLQGVSSRPSEHGDAFRWQRADWLMHREFISSSGFQSEFIPIGEDLMVEKITNSFGSYGMERRFARLDGNEWYLIYYAALHPL